MCLQVASGSNKTLLHFSFHSVCSVIQIWIYSYRCFFFHIFMIINYRYQFCVWLYNWEKGLNTSLRRSYTWFSFVLKWSLCLETSRELSEKHALLDTEQKTFLGVFSLLVILAAKTNIMVLVTWCLLNITVFEWCVLMCFIW